LMSAAHFPMSAGSSCSARRNHITPVPVPLPRFLAAELAGHVANLKPDDLVFTTALGSAVRSANWRQGVFLPVRKRAGISDRFRVHDLRHYADGWVMCPAVAFPLVGAEEPALQSA
jgi:integrase